MTPESLSTICIIGSLIIAVCLCIIAINNMEKENEKDRLNMKKHWRNW